MEDEKIRKSEEERLRNCKKAGKGKEGKNKKNRREKAKGLQKGWQKERRKQN